MVNRFQLAGTTSVCSYSRGGARQPRHAAAAAVESWREPGGGARVHPREVGWEAEEGYGYGTPQWRA